MSRFALLLLLPLAACATAPRGTEVATLDYRGKSYPVLETSGGWKVRVDNRLVSCRTDAQDDCYWSLRHHLDTQRRLANIEDPDILR